MRISVCLAFVAVVIAGCSDPNSKPGVKPPTEGTIIKSNMTLEEKIKAIENDRNFPPSYKQTMINSLKQEAAKQGGAR